jgi:hypothetical protein
MGEKAVFGRRCVLRHKRRYARRKAPLRFEFGGNSTERAHTCVKHQRVGNSRLTVQADVAILELEHSIDTHRAAKAERLDTHSAICSSGP